VCIKPKTFEEILTPILCYNSARLELTLNPGIVGTLPSELAKLTALEFLGIGRMGMYGRLPTELGLLTELETLGIEGNELTGAIPTELGRATALGELLRDYDCYACCV